MSLAVASLLLLLLLFRTSLTPTHRLLEINGAGGDFTAACTVTQNKSM